MIDNDPQQQPESLLTGSSQPRPEEILARLRHDIPTADFLPSPPPLPQMNPPFSLRPADPDPESSDADLVAEWMSRPHLRETWEQPWPAERWRQDWVAKTHTTYARAAILSYSIPRSPHIRAAKEATRGDASAAPTPSDENDATTPVGYVEIYRPHRDEIGSSYLSQPHDLGAHIAIGKPELTGHGIFSSFLSELAAALLEQDPQCQLVLGEPDYRNTRTHRALAKSGFQDFGERQQRADRRVRLFGLTRPSAGREPQQRLEATP